MPDPPSDSTALAITWDDILKPGEVGAPSRADLFADIPQAAADATGFSLANACFLASQSLLIYRRYSNTESPDFPGRHDVLSRLGWEEKFCGEVAGTLCSILEPLERGAEGMPVAVVFRGSSHFKNWLTNLQSIPTAWPGGGHVHGGFAGAQNEIWENLAPRLDAIARAGHPLLITGHSYGGALATLTLSQYLSRHPAASASAYTFGSPRVGNAEFASSMDAAPLYRIVNRDDLVTRLPPPFALSRRMGFLHAGSAYYIDSHARLHPRGRGDLAEESAGITQIAGLLRHASDAFKRSRPPVFLADHAPAQYLENIRRAHAQSPSSSG